MRTPGVGRWRSRQHLHAIKKRRNLITDLGKVLAQLSSVSCFIFEKTPPSPALVTKLSTHKATAASQRGVLEIVSFSHSPRTPSFTPDILFSYLLTCVLLPMNERGFPPPPAKGEKGHSGGSSLPSFPLVLVCCCSPSKDKQKRQSMLAQTVPAAHFQVQASAFRSEVKPFTLNRCFLQSLDWQWVKATSTWLRQEWHVADSTCVLRE